jgi:hypothetical protein
LKETNLCPHRGLPSVVWGTAHFFRDLETLAYGYCYEEPLLLPSQARKKTTWGDVLSPLRLLQVADFLLDPLAGPGSFCRVSNLTLDTSKLLRLKLFKRFVSLANKAPPSISSLGKGSNLSQYKGWA